MSPVTENSVRVLLVDDHAQIRTAFERVLNRAGYAVVSEEDVPGACARLRSDREFDVVLTDLSMPSGTGLDVLEVAREIDPALQVVFVTGTGDVEMAQRALEHGALRYLTKPVAPSRLLAAIEEACRARAAVSNPRSAMTRLRALEGDLTRVKSAQDLDLALSRLWMAYQPVVSMSRRRVIAYEALVRSDHAPLARPDLLIGAAEELGRLPELGRTIRGICAAQIPEMPADVDLLINLHPNDLEDPELYDPEAPLTQHARRVILEITERASLDGMGDVCERIERLRGLGYRIAVDDLGAGYGSLSAIALIRPDLVKLDMSLIRNVHQDPVRARMVRSIGAMCQQLGTPWLCEGVETVDELRVLAGAGADMVQGYLLGKPARQMVAPSRELYESVPRFARASRPSQRIALGAMAQGLCREAMQIVLSRGTDPDLSMTEELRTVLGALRDLIDHITDDSVPSEPAQVLPITMARAAAQ
jgi:EAL domain-containing protein (putative c-di-GMP-specific phosphodiesterase class I)